MLEPGVVYDIRLAEYGQTSVSYAVPKIHTFTTVDTTWATGALYPSVKQCIKVSIVNGYLWPPKVFEGI